MSDIAINPSIHADIRGASRSYNRDKNHATKWIFGARTTVKKPALDSAWTANTPPTAVKVIPEKWNGRLSGHANKSHGNVSTKARGLSHYNIQSANLRATRKSEALREVLSPDARSLSRSLADLLPSNATSIPISKHEAPDAGILYSFDKKASPSDAVGLEGLIEKAEQRWREKETIKLVRSEYEVLGADGEREVVKKGGGRKEKAGGGNSAAVKDVVVSPGGLDDDEDYELV